MIRHILVLCVGNICRSPMAQGLLQHSLADRIVSSAGFAAVEGACADASAVAVSAAAGIDITGHRARQLSHAHLASADLVLVMNDRQKNEVQLMCPAASGRVFRIGDLSGHDVPDPHGASYAGFEQVFELIRWSVQTWVPRIRAFA
ncbi:MAG: low molecular weight phosphotyrosine protein phosphatase [Cupriavidus sp.]|nr:low molecular weight phosphotyrosine protein phosphatase [Cupriavidus sp.]